MLTENEVAIQCYLHEHEGDLGAFILRCIEAKISNRRACVECGEHLAGTEFLVTPQEELYVKFFNEGIAIAWDKVNNGGILELRAHREELSRISFEAKAMNAGADKVEREYKAKNQRPEGFGNSLPDELTTDAINKIKKRQTKGDKMLSGLMALGMSREEAEKLMSPKTIVEHLKNNKPFTAISEFNKPEDKPFKNPFVPEPNTPTPTTVTIIEETNTVIITEEKKETPKPAFINPFAK